MGSTVYPTRLFSGTSPTIAPPQQPQHMYTSPASRLNNSYSPQYPINDYFVGHVCSGNPPQFSLHSMNGTTVPPPDSTTNYTCIGAPVGQGFPLVGGNGGGGSGSRDMSPSTVNRNHQDGF